MKFLIIVISMLSLLSCGSKTENKDKNNPPNKPELEEVVNIEAYTAEQITSRCGTAPMGISILGKWTSDLGEGVYPNMLLDFEFLENQIVKVGVSCKVNEVDYNYKMIQTRYQLVEDQLSFSFDKPVTFTMEEDGVDCRLDYLNKKHKLGSQGECLSIQFSSEKVFLVRN